MGMAHAQLKAKNYLARKKFKQMYHYKTKDKYYVFKKAESIIL